MSAETVTYSADFLRDFPHLVPPEHRPAPRTVHLCLARLTDYPLAWQDKLRESRLGFEGSKMIVPADVYADAEAARVAAEG